LQEISPGIEWPAGAQSAMPQTTFKRYFVLLEAAFLIELLPPWSANLSKRLIQAPKVFVSDIPAF
jgi:predicted AAA+ superfamily ATPase